MLLLHAILCSGHNNKQQKSDSSGSKVFITDWQTQRTNIVLLYTYMHYSARNENKALKRAMVLNNSVQGNDSYGLHSHYN